MLRPTRDGRVTSDFGALLSRFPSQRVLVVGDVMLDSYWMGEASRISPEAPVPVIRKQQTVCYPGGAGNVALNVMALGAKATLMAVVGQDEAAAELRRALAKGGVSTDYLITDRSRRTTVKTRVIAGRQQITRIDEEDTHSLPADQESELLRSIEEQLQFCDCVLVSDYAKGLISATFAPALLGSAAMHGVPVIVDPKGMDAVRYRGATMIKPNRAELSELTGVVDGSHGDGLEACERLQSLLPDTAVLLTEGPKGMTLRLPGGEHFQLPTRALELLDVTGAGDTALAVAGVAVAAGADFWAAAFLANAAAGVVVGEFGCGTVSVERLRSVLAQSGVEAASALIAGTTT